MRFSSPISELPLSKKFVKKLNKLGLKKISDLIFYFPIRYEDFSKILKISQLKPGQICCVQGKILTIENTKTPKKRMTLTQALVQDQSGAVKVVWFNQPFIAKVLKQGDQISVAGKVQFGTHGLYFSNPSYEKIKQDQQLYHTGKLIPVYSEVSGISSKLFRWLISRYLKVFQKKIPETLPQEILAEYNLMPLKEALKEIHFPETLEKAKEAKRRFQFEEMFLVQLSLLRERLKLKRELAPAIPINVELLKKFSQSLPFELTKAQKKAAWQILKDMAKPWPMNRLLQGDVGSGKTVVAVIAALNSVKAGFQVAFMVPTEILARQHFNELAKLLENFRINIGLLTGKRDQMISKKLPRQIIEVSRQKLLKLTQDSQIDILIGTHALIQDKVKFGKLALVILDEQHRFGVEQRAKLIKDSKSQMPNSNFQSQKRYIPHLLSMSATPIPRTLALSLYGDLDLSIIDELPKGRKKIITKIIDPQDREKIYDFIRKEVKEGRQAFVICPRIEDSSLKDERAIEKAEIKAVKKEYEYLSKNVFPEFKVAMLHGKMKTTEKEKTMQNFRDGKYEILVSTSVVEVGIDVPKASIMIIEGAERFGLAQLHQFRGRVGRATHQAYCFLFTESSSKTSHQRLKALIELDDGFKLAEKDLELRGPGAFFGVKQWGMPDLAMSALTDIKLATQARQAAAEILSKDPELKNYPEIKVRLMKFEQVIHQE